MAPPRNAVDITDHGASPSDSDPNSPSVIDNTEAIRDAMEEAGDGGSIYVPSGTYWIGSNSEFGRLFHFGPEMPTGISMYGDGPGESELAVSEYDYARSRVGSVFTYGEGYDHGEMYIEEIKFDGNYENIEHDEGTGAHMFNMTGDGEVHASRVWIRGSHMSGFRDPGGMLRSVDYCTFEDVSFGRRRDSGFSSITHGIETQTPDGTELTISNCLFKDVQGSALNIRGDTGMTVVRNCYASGTGANFCKFSAGNLTIEGLYHEANTESLEEKSPDDEFLGLNFIMSMWSREGQTKDLIMNDVVTRSHREYALQSRNDSDIEWTGDNIAILDSLLDGIDKQVIKSAKGGRLNLDLGRLSVHDCNGKVFGYFDGGVLSGYVDEMAHDGNKDGIGDTDDLDFGTVDDGGPPFEPSVPTEDEVGAFGEKSESPPDDDDDNGDEPVTSEVSPAALMGLGMLGWEVFKRVRT